MSETKPGFHPEQQDLQESLEFNKHLPTARISRTGLELVPTVARDYFEDKSGELINPQAYTPGNFDQIYEIVHGDGSKTYVATQTKTYNTNKETEELAYFVDIEGNQRVGNSELRYNLSSQAKRFKKKPFVGQTRTREDKTRQGLGTRRLQTMNAFSQMTRHIPLYSDTLMTPEARGVWELLVSSGQAHKIQDGKHDRYVFNT